MSANSEAAARQSLRKLNREIAARRDYLKRTELEIQETVERGNSELLAIDVEVKEARKALKDLKQEIRNATHEKNDLLEGMERLREDILAQASQFEHGLAYS